MTLASRSGARANAFLSPTTKYVEVKTPPKQLRLVGQDPTKKWIPGTGTGCKTDDLNAEWGKQSGFTYHELWLLKEETINTATWPKWRGLNPHTTYNQVANWLKCVVDEFKYHPLTLLLCLRVMHKFFDKKNVTANQAQLVATTALLIASKVHQILHKTLVDHAEICENAYTEKEIKSMEVLLLDTIQYDLFKPTAWDFMHWYYHRAMRLKPQPQLPDEAEVLFLVELAVMHLKMWQFKPSMLVAVCIFIALDGEVHLRWTGQHFLLTGYHLLDLKPCTDQLRRLLTKEEKCHLSERLKLKVDRRDQVIRDHLDKKPAVLAKFMPGVLVAHEIKKCLDAVIDTLESNEADMQLD